MNGTKLEGKIGHVGGAREFGKDLTNLMECLKKQSKDNKPILYVGRIGKKVISTEEEYLKIKEKAECWEMYLKKPNEVRFVIVYLTSTINADYKDYCLVVDENYKLTQEEFDKLKRGLGL